MGYHKKFNLALNGSVALALVTAFLYASYTAYNHGYLITFGIDTTIFNKSFHQALYGGMLACVIFSTPFIIYGFFTAMLFSAIFYFYSDFASRSIKNKRKIVKLKRNLSLKPSTKAERLSNILIPSAVLSVLFFIAFIGIFVGFERVGKKEAYRIIKQYKKNTLPDSKLVQIKNDKSSKTKTLYIVDCGSDMCAGLDMATGRVIYFNKKSQSDFVVKKTL